MRIDSGTIGMDSAHAYSSTEYSARRFSASLRNSFGAVSSQGDDVGGALGGLSEKIKSFSAADIPSVPDISEQLSRLREEFINRLLRLLFPDRKLELNDEGLTGSTETISYEDYSPRASVSYISEFYYEEYESTSFSAEGVVKCSDGRTFDIGINVEMSRSFMQYYSEEADFLEASLTDPLVINFDGSVPDLSDMTFSFDIDSDGNADELSILSSGSGFLAYDINEDGIINDGSELFGTKSGNGFDDLAFYDTDRDGFIDEDDEIFDKLKIMTVDENGNTHLYSLKEKDVGAICLKNASTEFSVNSLEDNSVYGKVRNTGVFLFENGRTGIVSQIDLAKRIRASQAYSI